MPVLFIFRALASQSGIEGSTTMHALILVAEEIGIGAAVGVGMAALASWLLKQFFDLGWISETWKQLPIMAVAISTFALTQYLGGSGFVALWVAICLAGSLKIISTNFFSLLKVVQMHSL